MEYVIKYESYVLHGIFIPSLHCVPQIFEASTSLRQQDADEETSFLELQRRCLMQVGSWWVNLMTNVTFYS